MKELRAVVVFVFRIDKGKYNFYLIRRGKNIPKFPSSWTPIASILTAKDEVLYNELHEKHGDISEHMRDKIVALRLLLERNLIIDPELNSSISASLDFRQQILEMDPTYLNVLFHSMVPCGFQRLLMDERTLYPNYYLFISPATGLRDSTRLSQYSEFLIGKNQTPEIQGKWFEPSKIINDYEKMKDVFDNATTTIMYKLHEEKKKLVDTARELEAKKSLITFKETGFLPYIWTFKTPAHTPKPFSESNIYIVGNQKRYIIDPGSTVKKNISPIIEYIEKNIDKMEGILLTNSYADHVNQALHFKDEYNLPIFASKKTAEDLVDDDFIFNSYLEDGTKMDLGSYTPLGLSKWELETVNLPGYTEGQIGFWDPRGVLFASSLFHKDMISSIAQYPGAYSDLIQSYNRISKFKVKYALTGHRDFITDLKSIISFNLLHFSKYEKTAIEQLKSGITSRDSIMQEIHSLAQFEWECLARNVADVILAKLCEEDKVSKRGEDYFWLKNANDEA